MHCTTMYKQYNTEQFLSVLSILIECNQPFLSFNRVFSPIKTPNITYYIMCYFKINDLDTVNIKFHYMIDYFTCYN